MAKNFVFSTLATNQRYQNYEIGGAQPVAGAVVFIKGGAGVAGENFVTPMGVPTEVTDEELGHLEKNQDFQLHKKNGFITVQTKKFEAEKVAADMNRADKSAPLTPADYLDKDVTVVLNKDI